MFWWEPPYVEVETKVTLTPWEQYLWSRGLPVERLVRTDSDGVQYCRLIFPPIRNQSPACDFGSVWALRSKLCSWGVTWTPNQDRIEDRLLRAQKPIEEVCDLYAIAEIIVEFCKPRDQEFRIKMNEYRRWEHLREMEHRQALATRLPKPRRLSAHWRNKLFCILRDVALGLPIEMLQDRYRATKRDVLPDLDAIIKLFDDERWPKGRPPIVLATEDREVIGTFGTERNAATLRQYGLTPEQEEHLKAKREEAKARRKEREGDARMLQELRARQEAVNQTLGNPGSPV